MRIAEDLVGIWSVDQMYAPGAASDELVIFTSDGTGWIETLNWASIHVETFRWWISVEGKLNLQGKLCYSMFEPRQEVSTLELKNLSYKIVERLSPREEKIKVVTFSKPICYGQKKFGSNGAVIPEGYLEERINRVEEASRAFQEETGLIDIEDNIINTCSTLLLQIRGNTAGGDCAFIDKPLIQSLHTLLDSYAHLIEYQTEVNKHVVNELLFTCSWFYTQSKYSSNSQELIEQFEKLQEKLISVFRTHDDAGDY